MKLLDTSVLVDIDRGNVDRKVQALDGEGRHAISIVSVTELRLGASLRYERESEAYREAAEGLDRLLARFEIVPVSRPVATAVADIIGTLTELADLLDVGKRPVLWRLRELEERGTVEMNHPITTETGWDTPKSRLRALCSLRGWSAQAEHPSKSVSRNEEAPASGKSSQATE